MENKWFKILTPILQMFESIDNDGAGPNQISLNNQRLARELDLKALEKKLDNSLENETEQSLTEWIKQKRKQRWKIKHYLK